MFDSWSSQRLPAFGLVKWARNVFAHLGKCINAGLFTDRQQCEACVSACVRADLRAYLRECGLE